MKKVEKVEKVKKWETWQEIGRLKIGDVYCWI